MSEKRTRQRRPTPARTSPIRDFSTVLHPEPAKPTASAEPQPEQANGQQPRSDFLSDTVAQGARLGYAVIQEQIRQGQLIAQQWTQGKRPGNGFDVSALLQRTMHLSTDLGALLFDVTSAITKNGAGDARRADGASTTSAGVGAQSVANVRMSVEIEARGHTKVMLDLSASAIEGHLHVPALYSLAGDSPPLTRIAFEGLALRVQIPDEQPAGTYSGVVVDRRTNEPRGTLSVQLTR